MCRREPLTAGGFRAAVGGFCPLPIPLSRTTSIDEVVLELRQTTVTPLPSTLPTEAVTS
jgi:hypothetical protein